MDIVKAPKLAGVTQKLGKITLALSILTLSSCASVVASTNGPSTHGNLIYAGTKLNASIISKASCKRAETENYGCAYDSALAPFSVIDFLPSLVLDSLFLPFTVLHCSGLLIPDTHLGRECSP